MADHLVLEGASGDSLYAYKRGQVDFVLEVWEGSGQDGCAEADLTYVEALKLYRWLKEALGQ